MTLAVDDANDAYTRGVAAGEVNARLAQHDKHFADMNGNIKRLGDRVHELAVQMQRMSDSMAAQVDKNLATATALKDAAADRRLASEERWSVWQRLLALLTGVSAIGAIVAVVVTLSH